MKKNKVMALAWAGILAVSVLLAGTYAWQSISQRALNQVRENGEPGGRLHDDFNFLKDGNKDVYVENFTDPDDANSQPIYARIRLDEYMEIGPDAGISGRDVHKVKVIGDSSAKLEDMNTWTTYLWEREKKIEAGATVNLADEISEFRKYILWNQDANGNYKTNGVTNYMPTFNKNKDSKESEINGTMEGFNGIPYADHISYLYDAANLTDPTKTSIQTNFAVYDADMDDVDELTAPTLPAGVTIETILKQLTNTAGNDWNTAKLLNNGTPLEKITVAGIDYEIYVSTDNAANPTAVECVEVNLDGTMAGDYAIRIVKEEHTAKQTLANGDIISMDQWLSSSGKDKQPGNYWVYDEDGWVYWANPIEPSEVTSLLLDKIELRSDAKIKDEYYYAINVVAQFASRGQWGDCTTATTVVTDSQGNVTVTTGDGTGFYSKANGGMTNAAGVLLNIVSETPYQKYTVAVTSTGVTGTSTAVAQGGTITFQANVTTTTVRVAPAISWTVENKNGAALSKKTSFSNDAGAQTTLTVGVEDIGAILVVKATYTDADQCYGVGEFEIEVTEGTQTASLRSQIGTKAQGVRAGDVSTYQTIMIDDQEWLILAVSDKTDSSGNIRKQALLYAACALDYDGKQTYNWKDTFGTNNIWRDSNIRAYLNNTGDYKKGNGFKDVYEYCAVLAEETDITTRESIDAVTGANSEFITTSDKVFLLSETDLFGSFLGRYTNNTYARNTVVPNDYTVKDANGNGVKLMQTDDQRKDPDEWTSWLRSPLNTDDGLGYLHEDGFLSFSECTRQKNSLRPAFWVDITGM